MKIFLDSLKELHRLTKDDNCYYTLKLNPTTRAFKITFYWKQFNEVRGFRQEVSETLLEQSDAHEHIKRDIYKAIEYEVGRLNYELG